MTVIEIPCNNWIDFRGVALPRVFGGNAFIRGRYYFRGQSSDKFGLKSSFDRWYESAGIVLPRPDVAKLLIDSFQEERLNSADPPKNKESRDEILALAQHYGIPTRLLDWSESPYIAAFFAFANLTITPDDDAKVSIWCLDTHNSVWKEDKGASLISIEAPYNERLKSQLGKFTLLQSPFDTVEAHLTHCNPRGNVIWKITIPAREAIAALSDLDFMGVHYGSIYRGTEGCARAALTRVLLRQQKRPAKKPAVKRVKRRKRITRRPTAKAAPS